MNDHELDAIDATIDALKALQDNPTTSTEAADDARVAEAALRKVLNTLLADTQLQDRLANKSGQTSSALPIWPN